MVPDMTDWSDVVHQHGPVVWKTAWRLLGNEADAADCFQNTFLAALKVSRKQTVRSWSALLRRLATTKALDRLRQRYRQSGRLVPLDDCPAVAARASGPDRQAEADELAEQLRDAIAALDDRQAAVFCLAWLESLPHRQIAEQLGLTVTHVGVLLHRARAQLRRLLRAHAPQGAGRVGDKEIRT
jgi:RNA polymerase sigma factor (sigma-70 family)